METRHQLLGLFIRPLTKIYSQENYLDFGESVFDQKYGYEDVGGLHFEPKETRWLTER